MINLILEFLTLKYLNQMGTIEFIVVKSIYVGFYYSFLVCVFKSLVKNERVEARFPLHDVVTLSGIKELLQVLVAFGSKSLQILLGNIWVRVVKEL